MSAGITGDFNPMHVNEEYAETTRSQKNIAYGPLTESLTAPALGMKLPGLGTVVLELFCRFRAPVYFCDSITASAEAIEKREDKKWVRMKLVNTNQNEEQMAEGEALVMPLYKKLAAA